MRQDGYGMGTGRARGTMRWLVLGASVLVIGGCATPQAVERASAKADAALAHSTTIEGQVAAERQARQALAADLDARLKTMSADQTRLARRLAATDARLSADEARYKRRFASLEARAAQPSPATGPVAVSEPAEADFMATLVKRARNAAAHPYQPPKAVSTVLTGMDYPAYERLRFKGAVPGWPDAALLHPSFYPAGYLFHHAVKIHLLEGDKPVALEFPVGDFNFDTAVAKQIAGPVPLAGFSLYYPFNQGAGVNEFLSFLGASYFRALGKGQAWGLSARGLAVDTAVPHHAEEFPYFRDFWIVPPRPGANKLEFYALLSSPSFAGAYRFVVQPGTQTVVDVDMTLFVRKSVKRLGIAPLTSMYLQGRDGGPRFDPLVRAAHDSDGLSIETADGRWLWMPLRNPKRLAVDEMSFDGIKGFGLMQRARRYADYQAWGMEYQKRPSAWVTPTGGDWGKGRVVLVELPTRTQTNDNITAFWEPADRPKPGEELKFSYRIAWQGDQQTLPPLGHVVSTRSGHAADGDETYVINFRGGDLDDLPAWVHLEPVVSVDGDAKLIRSWTAKNEATGDWRLEFTIKQKGNAASRVRAHLAYGKRALTETWDAKLPLD
ncbi:glucan biosynthesis protein [Acidihalobacter prosperus]|nr:glucan biosynthesis protein [Acidihalobacter prosperus]